MPQDLKTGVKDLFSWKSLSRRTQKYPKEFFGTIGVIALLLSLIFAFFQEWLAILVTWSAVFLAYALSRLPAEEVEHKITTQGIVSMGKSYIWAELGPFWFSIKDQDVTLHIAHRNILGQLIIVVDKSDEEKIRDTLADYLPYIEVPEKSVSERISEWFSKRFPLEHKSPSSPLIETEAKRAV